MSIEFPCPGCQKTLRVADEHAGKQARCPHCQTVTPVPLQSGQGAAEKPTGGPGTADTTLYSPFRPATSSEDFASSWRLRIEDGREFGPVSRKELDQWMAEGRVTPACQIQREGESTWRPATELYPALASAGSPAAGGAMSSGGASSGPGGAVNPFSDQASYQAANPYASPPGSYFVQPTFQKSHRGNQVLTYGILGFVCCFLFGIAAWAMGAKDLSEMRTGVMDPRGRGLTQAGMIIGIVSTILGALSMALQAVMLASQ